MACLFSCLSAGSLKKTVEIVIRDDAVPEDNESLMIGLVNTAGGSRILPSSDTVTIVILANDNVAGIVGFHPGSRSIIAREGGWLCFVICKCALIFSLWCVYHVRLILLFIFI